MERIVTILRARYEALIRGTKSAPRVVQMLAAINVNVNVWPPDKTGRWLGYVQCLLIEVEGVTTVAEERDFTRPLFHKYYTDLGLCPPPSFEVYSE